MGNDRLTERARPEVAQWLEGLFGGDWRAMLSWLTTGCAAVWVYFGLVAGGSLDPIGWFAGLTRSFGLPAPAWIVGLPVWLSNGQRGWVPVALTVAAAAAVAVLARPGVNHGLSVLTTIDLGILISVHRSLDPLWWVIGLAAVPVLIAGAIQVKQTFWGVEEGGTWYFWDVAMVRLFLGLSVMWLPLALPVIVLAELVRSYGHPEQDDAVDDVRSVVRRMNAEYRAGRDVHPVDLALLESCLARLDGAQHRRARATIRFALESPTGAKVVRVGR